jgi:CBS domain-containing protein
MSGIANPEGSYVMPAFEHAKVSDAMRAGVMTCAPDTPLVTVARMMATNHIHSVIVTGADGGGDGAPWGIVSDLDVVRSAGEAEERSAGEVCATEVVTVSADESLERAAQLMAEHENAHLVVVDGGAPVGVISTLDIAGVLAWARA